MAKTYHNGGYQFDVDPPPAWVDVLPAPTQWHGDEDDKGQTWRNWVWDQQIDRRHGDRVRYIDYVYQPLTAAAVADASKFQIGYLPDFEKLTIHRVQVLRDGLWSDRLKPETITLARRESEFESDMATGEVTALLVFEDIRVGDVVRVSYSIAGANPVLAGLVADGTTIGGSHQVQYERYRVILDPGVPTTVVRDPRIAPERTEDLPGGKRITIEEHDLKPISTAGDYPRWFYPAPIVMIAQRHSWKDIADWARGLYSPPRPLPDDLQQQIAQWAKLPDPRMRAVRALEAVQDQVRYFGLEIGQNSHRPAEPADVWRRREGDCKDKARLLVAILAQLGIHAEPALVSTRGGDWALHQPPSADAFDHVIVRAHFGADTVWLDPTRTLQRGDLDQHAVSAFGYALPLVAGSDALVPVVRTPAEDAKWQVDERYTPTADGKNVHLQVVTEGDDTAAEVLRGRVADTDLGKLQDRYRNFYGKRFQSVTVAAPLQVRDDPLHDRVQIEENYTLADPSTRLDGGVLGIDTRADGIDDFTRMPSALGNPYPVDLDYPVQVEHRIELDLPKGWHWEGQAMHKSIDGPGFTYSLETAQIGTQVSFVHRYRSTAAFVDGKEVNRYADALRQVNDLEGRRFVVTRDAADQRDDRLQRLVKGILDGSGGDHVPGAADGSGPVNADSSGQHPAGKDKKGH
ncbi:MAG: DUF3857 domain-containing protein [Proteobacteria bacterium]|nr:DUF3857 domain-containing protein [Pseudomonadota bacterium]